MLKCTTMSRHAGLRTQQLREELGKMLPVFTQQTRTLPSVVSFSSIAVASGRGATLSATATHSVDCPVRARKLPLGLIAKEPSFLKRPCDVCLAMRTHFVSSELFSQEFEGNCCGTSREAIPANLEKALIRSFGSVDGMRRTVLNFCTGSLAHGRTWLVCRQDESLAVVTMAGAEIPQMLGLWPLAVVEVSEAVLCREVEARGAADVAAQHPAPPPAWSRAARNPSSMVASLQRSGVERDTLTRLRTIAAETALETMNWSFVDGQLTRATAYFRSEVRRAKQATTRSQHERDAARNALKHLKTAQSGAADDVDDLDVDSAVKSAHAAQPDTPADHATPVAETPANATAVPVPEVEEPELTPTTDTDPVTVQLPDGAWEYRYKNGDVTRLHSDGKKVFKTHGLTTTVYPNTDTLFEYENKTTILDRADGMRVTTFPDGRKTEERIK